jgi:hypothetical protein
LTATYETDKTNEDWNVITRPEHTFPITTKQLFQLALGYTNANPGLSFEFDYANDQFVAIYLPSKSIPEYTPLSQFSANESTSYVESGAENNITEGFNETFKGITTIAFNDGYGHSFSLSGIAKSLYFSPRRRSQTATQS